VRKVCYTTTLGIETCQSTSFNLRVQCFHFPVSLTMRIVKKRLCHMLWNDLLKERVLVSDSRNVSEIKLNYGYRNVGRRSFEWFASITIFSNKACIPLPHRHTHQAGKSWILHAILIIKVSDRTAMRFSHLLCTGSGFFFLSPVVFLFNPLKPTGEYMHQLL
jgi:hypothetical protein